jgi:hypothetical protein
MRRRFLACVGYVGRGRYRVHLAIEEDEMTAARRRKREAGLKISQPGGRRLMNRTFK